MKDTVKLNNTKGCRIIAHRGVSGLECENTCAAFVAAGQRTYYGIETDTHTTLDGEFVILHDASLERVAGVSLNVEESAYADLANVRLYDKETGVTRSDLVVPKLEEYIRICKRYGKVSVLELKSVYSKDDIAVMAELIRSLGHLDMTVFISFSKDNVINVREALPDARIQFLAGAWDNRYIDFLDEYGLDLDIHYNSVTKEIVDLVHAHGHEINVWTVDSMERAEELIELGVDYLTSNICE